MILHNFSIGLENVWKLRPVSATTALHCLKQFQLSIKYVLTQYSERKMTVTKFYFSHGIVYQGVDLDSLIL